MENILLCNCHILTGEKLLSPGWLKIKRGKIVDFGKGDRKGDLDGRGAYLLPGLIDFHCCAFQNLLYPRPGSYVPPRIAKSCHNTMCLRSGISTVINTIRLSDIAVWNELDGTRPEEAEVICRVAPSEVAPNQFIHLRCDIAWVEIVPKTISFSSQYLPRVISFIRCRPGVGRFQEPEKFKIYLAQRGRNSNHSIPEILASRNSHTDDLWARAEEIISSTGTKNIVFCLHDPGEMLDIEMAVRLNFHVAEFPLNNRCATEAKNRGIAICMGAPNVLRGRSQYGNLSTKEVWKAGNLDILTSDYYPPSLLGAIFRLSSEKNGKLSPQKLAQAIRCATQIPAKILGLATKGSIAEGMDADLILVNARDGMEPEVEMTIVGGVIKYSKNPEKLLCFK